MSWDARQMAMLAAMGLRVWPRESATVVLQEEAAAPQDAPQIQDKVSSLARSPEERAPVPQAVVTAAAALPQALRQAAVKPVEAEPVLLQRQDVAALDLHGLRQSAAECQACGLGQGQHLPVFGEGAAQAQCLVVVDAEGGDHGDAPLGGDAGLLLANILRAMGLVTSGEQANAFVTSPLKCRPQAGRAAGPAELQQCQPYLARQIELLRPRVILAMGPLSSQALLQSAEPLGRLRGRLHDYQGIPVVLTYHPAYLLRQQADKPRAWSDLCLALAALDSKTPT